jgi:hypothetical protein
MRKLKRAIKNAILGATAAIEPMRPTPASPPIAVEQQHPVMAPKDVQPELDEQTKELYRRRMTRLSRIYSRAMNWGSGERSETYNRMIGMPVPERQKVPHIAEDVTSGYDGKGKEIKMCGLCMLPTEAAPHTGLSEHKQPEGPVEVIGPQKLEG